MNARAGDVDPRRGRADDHARPRASQAQAVHRPRSPTTAFPQTLPDRSGFLHTDDGALAVGQPHGATTWYPVNDHPSDKASYTFEITVPQGLEAISNGYLKRRDRQARQDDVDLGRA